MELALDFHAFAGGCCRHCTPSIKEGSCLCWRKAEYCGSIGQESILPAKIISHCFSLVPVGVHTAVGVNSRLFFTRLLAVWHHLHRLSWYCEARWAQKWRARAAQHVKRHKLGRRHGPPVRDNPNGPQVAMPRERRITEGNKLLCHGFLCRPHGRTRLHAGVAVPSGLDGTRGGAVLPPEEAVFRPACGLRYQTRKRLHRPWVCEQHQHRQCAVCAKDGHRVWYCC